MTGVPSGSTSGEDLAKLAERAARIITGGAGIKALAQLLADATGGDVLVEDERWHHLALAGHGADRSALPPSIAPYLNAHRPSDGEVVPVKIDERTHALCASMPGGSAADGICGYVTVFVRGKAHAGFGTALRIVASAAGVECLRRGGGKSNARRAFWERFLTKGFPDAGAVRDDATNAGVTLAPSYVAVVFDVEGVQPAAARELLNAQLEPAGAVLPPLALGGHVPALFPIRHQADVARARQAAAHAMRDLTGTRDIRAITCGIGGHHADVPDATRSFAEARQALALGRRLNGKASLTQFADLRLHALLYGGGDKDAFGRFADATLEPLAAYDRKHKTDLLKTLRLYFDVGENVKEAAERLSVHRHTIFYRLNQIAQILKVDLHAPKDQLAVRAALAIRQMHSEE